MSTITSAITTKSYYNQTSPITTASTAELPSLLQWALSVILRAFGFTTTTSTIKDLSKKTAKTPVAPEAVSSYVYQTKVPQQKGSPTTTAPTKRKVYDAKAAGSLAKTKEGKFNEIYSHLGLLQSRNIPVSDDYKIHVIHMLEDTRNWINSFPKIIKKHSNLQNLTKALEKVENRLSGKEIKQRQEAQAAEKIANQRVTDFNDVFKYLGMMRKSKQRPSNGYTNNLESVIAKTKKWIAQQPETTQQLVGFQKLTAAIKRVEPRLTAIKILK